MAESFEISENRIFCQILLEIGSILHQNFKKYPKKYYIYQAESTQVLDKEIDEEVVRKQIFGNIPELEVF